MGSRHAEARRTVSAGASVVVGVLLFIGLLASAGSAVGASGTSTGAGSALAPANPPPLMVGIDVNPNPVSQNSQFEVSASVSGGVFPYTFSWSSPNGCPTPGNTSSWSCSLGSTGNYPIGLVVTDSNGTRVSSSGSVTVTSGGNDGSGNGSNGNGSNGFNLSSFGPILLYGLIAGLVVFGLLVALTVGVFLIAVTLRRLPRPPRGGLECGSCHATVPGASKFCPQCGASLTPAKQG